MNILKYLSTYSLTFLSFLIIDFIWLAFISKNFYQKHIGSLLKQDINFYAAGIFYLSFVFAILVLVIIPAYQAKSIQQLILHSLLFGFITYGTYDLTNLTALKNWPLIITIVDILWGMTVSLLTGLAGFYFINKFLGQ